MMRILLLFALPEEYAAFRGATGPWRRFARSPFRSFLLGFPDREFLLVEAGMGAWVHQKALSWVLALKPPELVIGAGFAGSLTEELTVGDVCLGEAFALHHAGTDSFPSHGTKERMALHKESGDGTFSELDRLCVTHQLRWVRIVSVSQPQPKPVLGRLFGDRVSLVDMESYWVARFCYERHIPFLVVRSVSDGFHDEIDFDLAAISDRRGRVSFPLVLASVLKQPGLIRSYYHSWQRSRRASGSLGRVLAALIMLGPGELRALTKSLRYDGA